MITVVMPAYNEADIIEQTLREWNDQVIARIPGAELIVVNDCSTDRTGEILARLARDIPTLRPVTPDRNGGHGRALRLGFQHARQEWVFQTDSDRQHIPSDFWRLWELRDHSDFIFGVRAARADGWTRIAITNFMRMANFVLWGIWIRDANCPFRLMRREMLEKVLTRIPQDSFIPMVMLSIYCRRMHCRFSEVVVQHLPRRGGEQSLAGIWKWTRVGSRCLCQLIALRLRPMRG